MIVFVYYHQSARKTDEQRIDNQQKKIEKKQNDLISKHDSLTHEMIYYTKVSEAIHQSREDSLKKALALSKSNEKKHLLKEEALKNELVKTKIKNQNLENEYVVLKSTSEEIKSKNRELMIENHKEFQKKIYTPTISNTLASYEKDNYGIINQNIINKSCAKEPKKFHIWFIGKHKRDSDSVDVK
jgi:hypothetical protein